MSENLICFLIILAIIVTWPVFGFFGCFATALREYIEDKFIDHIHLKYKDELRFAFFDGDDIDMLNLTLGPMYFSLAIAGLIGCIVWIIPFKLFANWLKKDKVTKSEIILKKEKS